VHGLSRPAGHHVDLYYQHQVDRGTPIADTVDALSELLAQGDHIAPIP
jgi:aryl-alcohol dehydrogenase-like predicted oxidoreductase